MSGNNVDNVFKDLAKKSEGKTTSAILFVLSLVLLIFGANNFAEDTFSSYWGLKMIEQTFSIRVGSWEITYWLESLFFQVGTMLAMFVYVIDTKKYRLALWVALLMQVVDFFADVWYRSNSMVSPISMAVTFVLTFVFYTVGSELALTFGLSAVRYTAKDGLEQMLKVIATMIYALANGVIQGAQISKDYYADIVRHINKNDEGKNNKQQSPNQQRPQMGDQARAYAAQSGGMNMPPSDHQREDRGIPQGVLDKRMAELMNQRQQQPQGGGAPQSNRPPFRGEG